MKVAKEESNLATSFYEYNFFLILTKISEFGRIQGTVWKYLDNGILMFAIWFLSGWLLVLYSYLAIINTLPQAIFFTVFLGGGGCFCSKANKTTPKPHSNLVGRNDLSSCSARSGTPAVSISRALPVSQLMNVRDEFFLFYSWKVFAAITWNLSWEPLELFRLFTSLHNFQSFWLSVIQPLFLKTVNFQSWVTDAPISYHRDLGRWTMWGAPYS